MKWLGVLATVVLGVSGQVPKTNTAREAHAFLALLTSSQKQAAAFSYESESKTDWHYVPRQRLGVAWGGLNAVQKLAGHALLKASLSKAGYQKIEGIRALESVLRELERGNPGRDLENYSFVFFGQPSDDKPWAWRYEGHHISLTFAYRNGALIASTPQFLGSNPAEVPSGPDKGKQAILKERDLAFKLVESLLADQRTRAVISTNAPGDIVTGADRKAAIEGRKGIPYKELSADQKKAFLELLRAHAEVQSEKEQARRMKQIQDEDLDEAVFAWMGPVERKARHYYRIQGRNLIVEYDNTQPDGNHIHTVWRNLKEDFGQDPLLQHYGQGHN